MQKINFSYLAVIRTDANHIYTTATNADYPSQFRQQQSNTDCASPFLSSAKKENAHRQFLGRVKKTVVLPVIKFFTIKGLFLEFTCTFCLIKTSPLTNSQNSNPSFLGI